MSDLIKRINEATADEISDLSLALQSRYRELFPEWEILVVSIEKNRDHNVQIDNMILKLEGIRDYLHDKYGERKDRS
jgi:hypothetical protein